MATKRPAICHGDSNKPLIHKGYRVSELPNPTTVLKIAAKI